MTGRIKRDTIYRCRRYSAEAVGTLRPLVRSSLLMAERHVIRLPGDIDRSARQEYSSSVQYMYRRSVRSCPT